MKREGKKEEEEKKKSEEEIKETDEKKRIEEETKEEEEKEKKTEDTRIEEKKEQSKMETSANVKKEEDNAQEKADEPLIETETPTASIQLFLKQEPAKKNSAEELPETKKDAAEENELGDDLPSAMRFVQQRYNEILKSDQLATLDE